MIINIEYSSNWAIFKKKKEKIVGPLSLNFFFYFSMVTIWWYSCLNCLILHIGGFSWVHLLWWYKVFFGWFIPWWKASPCQIGFEFHVRAVSFLSVIFVFSGFLSIVHMGRKRLSEGVWTYIWNCCLLPFFSLLFWSTLADATYLLLFFSPYLKMSLPILLCFIFSLSLSPTHTHTHIHVHTLIKWVLNIFQS